MQRQIDILQAGGTLDKLSVARAASILDRQALVLPGDRNPLDVVLRRTSGLLQLIKAMPNAPDVRAIEKKLAALKAESASVCLSKSRESVLYGQYIEACGLRRILALSNPLLDFDQLLYLVGANKWHNPGEWIQHILLCENYGHTATSCGGIYRLSNLLSGQPSVEDLLENAVVQSGKYNRYAGREPAHRGAYNSLDLSFDATQIVFAWSACAMTTKWRR
jgi:hypothetical protein